MAKPNPKDFMLMDRKGETITREPGSLMGYDFVIDGCENCDIRLLDRTAQIQVDYCKDSKILIGPVGGSVFLRNCERCVILCACQQMRTRECVDCDIILLIPGHPIIETSRNIRFGALPRDCYDELEAQLEEANLTIGKNHWDNIYNFSPNDPPGCTHFTLMTPEDTAKALALFPAKPSALGAANAMVADAKASATLAKSATEATDEREVRVTAKRGAQFHANLCRAYLSGRPEADDKPALAPSLRVVLCGAGAAVGTAAQAAALLAHDGNAKIISIFTGIADTAEEKSGKAAQRHQVPVIRIALEQIGV